MFASAQALVEAAQAAVPRITPDQARDLIRTRDALLLDVRGADEIAQTGKLAGALHLPFGETPHGADPASPHRLPDFRKDRPVILYCASGRRSALDGHALKQMGYGEVFNLGGLRDALEAGFEVETA